MNNLNLSINGRNTKVNASGWPEVTSNLLGQTMFAMFDKTHPMEKQRNVSGWSEAANNLTGQPMFAMLAKAHSLEKQGRSLVHMELGDPDFAPPTEVIEAIVKAMNEGYTHYTASSGLPAFREAIKTALNKEFSLGLDLQQVIVTPGANSGIYWVMRCLLDAGDEVLIPDPGFASFKAAANAALVKAVPIKLKQDNRFRPNIDDVEASITNKTKLIIVNSPSNPTGACLPIEDLTAIYKLAQKYGLYVLSDDTYRRMTFGEDYAPSITQLDQCKERTILLSGLSKEYSMSGFRLGYLIGPEALMKKIGLYIETVVSCIPPFVQIGGIQALLGNQENRKKNLHELKQRRDIMVSELNTIPGISCLTPQGGLYVFPSVIETGMSGDEFADFALYKAGIVCVSGSTFGRTGKNNIRLSLNTDLNTIKLSVEKIKAALTKVTIIPQAITEQS